MLDNIIGLLLLGLGINKGIYTQQTNVKGDEIVATSSGNTQGIGTFHLNPNDYKTNMPLLGGKAASSAGVRRFDPHAFGLGVLKMQEDFADTVEASREAVKQEFENRQTEFKQQLARIRDTKKQAVVDKLNTNCQDINSKRTDKMTAMLEKLSVILTNVTNREASASAAGKDVTTVDTAVTAAQAAIADAQNAVAGQAGTLCTITITSETNLKTDVGKIISSMQSSLQSVYTKVLAAKQAVSSAIRALALVTGESLTPQAPKNASGSGTQ